MITGGENSLPPRKLLPCDHKAMPCDVKHMVYSGSDWEAFVPFDRQKMTLYNYFYVRM